LLEIFPDAGERRAGLKTPGFLPSASGSGNLPLAADYDGGDYYGKSLQIYTKGKVVCPQPGLLC